MKKTEKNKNKGFTLVEVLGTIVILGVIALIAVPMVSASREKMNNAYYENMTYLVKIAGQDYYSDNRNLLPIEVGSKGVVNLKQLEQLNYIAPVVSTNKNACEGYIEVSKNTGYQYKSCLKCDNYISDKNCDFTISGGTTTPNSTYLQIHPAYYEVGKGKPFIAPYASYYVDGTLVRNDIGATPNQINTNILTTHTLNYYYKNASPVSIQVKVIDITPPSTVSVSMKKESITGEVYTSGWTNKNIYQIFSATDTGSGVKGYEYSFTNNPSNNSLWTFTNSNNITQKQLLTKLGSTSKDINKTVYVRAVDNSGNKGPVASYNLAVDQTIPTCSSNGGNTSWTVTNITLIGTCSDASSGSGCETPSVSKTFTTDINLTNQSPGSVEDKAGNTATCPATQTVKIDKTKPTCVSSGGSNSWKKENVTLTGTCSDSLSGCVGNATTVIGVNTYESTKVSPGEVKDNAGNIATCPANQIVKIDKIPPKLTMVNHDNIMAPSKSLFSVEYSISKGSTVCTNKSFASYTGEKLDKKVNATNQDLFLGVNSVTCTATGGSGLSTPASLTYQMSAKNLHMNSSPHKMKAKNEFSDNIITEDRYTVNGNSVSLRQGSKQYGPYIPASKGCYQVIYNGNNLNGGKIGIHDIKENEIFKYTTIYTSYQHINPNIMGKIKIEDLNYLSNQSSYYVQYDTPLVGAGFENVIFNKIVDKISTDTVITIDNTSIVYIGETC